MKPQKARKTITTNGNSNNDPLNICQDCGIAFAKKIHYEEHTRLYHSDQDSRHYSCNECGALFARLTQLHEHSVHHDLASLIMAIHKSEKAKYGSKHISKKSAVDQPQSIKKRTFVSSSASLSGLSVHSSGSTTKLESIESPLTISIPSSPVSSAYPSSNMTALSSPFGNKNISKLTPPPKKKLKHSLSTPYQSAKSSPISRTPSESGDSAGSGASSIVLPSECIVCKQNFKNAWNMLVHAVEIHSAVIVKVEKKAFGPGETLLEEVNLNVDKICKRCDLSLPLPTSYLLHKLEHHRQELFVAPATAEIFHITVEIVCSASIFKDKPFRISVKVKKKLPTHIN